MNVLRKIVLNLNKRVLREKEENKAKVVVVQQNVRPLVWSPAPPPGKTKQNKMEKAFLILKIPGVDFF